MNLNDIGYYIFMEKQEQVRKQEKSNVIQECYLEDTQTTKDENTEKQ